MRPRRAFRPSRAKGQSFLKDPSVIARILSVLEVQREDEFLEIGAGSGELTLPLAARGPHRILAVEPEAALAQRLSDTLEAGNADCVEVVRCDFLQLDLSNLLKERGAHCVRVVGNLPYSAASPILLKLLSHRNAFRDMTLMFQLEVAERLVARPATKAYGVLSVLVQQASRPEILFQISPRAFRPRPRVHSALVRLEPQNQEELRVDDPAVFEALVKALFAHRRKNIANNIKHLHSDLLNEEVLRAGLSQLAINPTRRAETLAVGEFIALAHFCASRP